MWFTYFSDSYYFYRAVWYLSMASTWMVHQLSMVWYHNRYPLFCVLLYSLRSIKKVFHTWSKVSPFLIIISCNLVMFRFFCKHLFKSPSVILFPVFLFKYITSLTPKMITGNCVIGLLVFSPKIFSISDILKWAS